MNLECKISKILFETGTKGEIRALLQFNDERLKTINFSYLSVEVDDSITENSKLSIHTDDMVYFEFDKNNLKSYQIRRYSKKLTRLPIFCAVCNNDLRILKNISQKIKKIECVNFLKCGAHSRSVIYRLFDIFEIDYKTTTDYLNNHYSTRIDHLWDIVLIYNQNDSDPNTAPRENAWNNKVLWETEKTIYNKLKNVTLTNKQFWYVCFGIDLNIDPNNFDINFNYPKIVLDNLHLVKQLKLFFERFKND